MQDSGKLEVDPVAARAVVEPVAGKLDARLSALTASPPKLQAGRYGSGLADRAQRLVTLVNRTHDIRVAHAERLKQGVGEALGTVESIAGTDQVSRAALGGPVPGSGTRDGSGEGTR